MTANVELTVILMNIYLFTSIFAKKPNIVLFLTDDQDLLLGGLTPVKQVQQLIANQGATFKNAFVSTPICCPSRSTILTGLYQHNHGVVNNSLNGGCSGASWQQKLEPHTFGASLHNNGYTTFYAGKYLNTYGYKAAGGTQHVPPGWDWWLGLVGNSRYYNYTLSVNGTAHHFSDQYLTNIIGKYSVEFLESVKNKEESFLMVLATPAPHTPYTPEPKYRGKYEGIKVPRTPNFNTNKLKDRHWLLNMGPAPLPNATVATLDSYHARRWETLLSVDDMVASTIGKLKDIGQLNNTFIIYTSDHGYHLGQYALPWDKRQPYETDIRVPLLLRGPGVRGKSLVEGVVVSTDIAPTVLAMAGIQPPAHMDGRSFLPLVTSDDPSPPPRRAFLIEYVGEGDSNTVSPSCNFADANTLDECYPSSSCKCQDARNNTYNCVRSIAFKENYLYCEFYEEVGCLKEFYDIDSDPYQLNNIYQELNQSDQNRLRREVHHYKACSGQSC